ncbi:hypothetical protein [Bradyrhizobium sp.]|uniref:hypothetical protein n=1 Tax=Bradyrhizobium sp. TaxID=376 RepID=UPI002D554662|nr:hypothetical protein [Bradyrhizobium sp.]HZR74288.1 hypothetical protein [Bradyrhizobium sp.]
MLDGAQCRAPLRSADCTSARAVHEEQVMLDVILVAGCVGFFILSIAYAYGCDRL